jgi:leader peptidase (prepilin peptidase)/N-methyltransferase
MSPGLAALALVPGLALGSFLNVVAVRLPRHESVVRPGSHCMSCGAAIAWYDNLPLVSYLLLRGRCRSCGARIGWRYPAVELVTALLAAGCALRFGLTARALLAACFCAALVALAAIDLEHHILPNRIVLPGFAVTLAARTAIDPSLEWLLAALGASLFLFVAVLAYPRGMGMGDVKLALMLGAMLGKTVVIAVFVALIAALVPSIVLLARHGAAARKMAIPFGPFLALGSLVALFAGERLLNAYFSISL